MNKNNFKIQKPKPVYDKNGVIGYYKDDDYIYIRHNGGIEECTDFTIYHPLKNGKGEYECIPYSFYGSLTSFSEDKDLVDFLRTCFYTKEECNEWIERQKEQKLEEEDHITPNKKFFQWIYDRLVFIHGENPDVDYMRSLKDRIKEMSSKQKSAEVDESTKRLNENWMKQYFDDYKEKKPAEWSDEDEDMLNSCISSIEEAKENRYAYKETDGDTSYDREIDWLKSLRPSWKPSEQEKAALRLAIHVLTEDRAFPKTAEQLQNILNAFEGEESRKD